MCMASAAVVRRDNRRETVDFPAPGGPETMTSLPMQQV
jgi:hypothetical protein